MDAYLHSHHRQKPSTVVRDPLTMLFPPELGATNGGPREFDLPAKGLLDWLTRPTMVGKTVGKYRVLERIGRGGMGIVYKAVDETLDRDVASRSSTPTSPTAMYSNGFAPKP